MNAARSKGVSAVRVRHLLAQTDGMARLLRSQLREGAEWDELASAASDCEWTRSKGGEVGWSGVEDEHLDEILPREVRAQAIGMKPGDIALAPSARGIHVLQVVDVFQSLQIDEKPRTRGLPGSGVRPEPLIELLRASREDERSFKQLTAGGAGGDAGGGGAQLMKNSGKTARKGATMCYSMESMGCQVGWADELPRCLPLPAVTA